MRCELLQHPPTAGLRLRCTAGLAEDPPRSFPFTGTTANSEDSRASVSFGRMLRRRTLWPASVAFTSLNVTPPAACFWKVRRLRCHSFWTETPAWSERMALKSPHS
ncbi:hypothetical protein ACN28S_46525 [Cystobacter fuscus]